MTFAIAINSESINNLDLSPAQTAIENIRQAGAIADNEQQLKFKIDYPRDADDPRELPEIPEIRLWFIRLDACYPWLPFFLDWKEGELVRYAAMLVPHQFSAKEGIQFNPEALEIFLMNKIFVLHDWMQTQGIPTQARLKSMGQMFGYEFDDELFAMF